MALKKFDPNKAKCSKIMSSIQVPKTIFMVGYLYFSLSENVRDLMKATGKKMQCSSYL